MTEFCAKACGLVKYGKIHVAEWRKLADKSLTSEEREAIEFFLKFLFIGINDKIKWFSKGDVCYDNSNEHIKGSAGYYR